MHLESGPALRSYSEILSNILRHERYWHGLVIGLDKSIMDGSTFYDKQNWTCRFWAVGLVLGLVLTC